MNVRNTDINEMSEHWHRHN